MDRQNRRTAALVATAVVVTFLLCRTAPLVGSTQAVSTRWVKIGSIFINTDSINYAIDQKQSLSINTGDGRPGNSINFEGPDAESLRRWLDAHSNHPGQGEAPPPAAPNR
jgi:hypothetical protein